MNGWTLTVEGREFRNASLDAALRALDALAETEGTVGLGLDDDVNARMVVSFDDANQLGYFVTGRERDERGEDADQVQVDLSLGREVVVGTIGGQGDERPRFVFVGYDLARQALQTFFQTGRRDASLTWLPFEETTAPDRAPLTDDAIIQLWLNGDRVGAVGEYRRKHDVGLKEAYETLQSLTIDQS